MTLDLDAIQARADAATPGPWTVEEGAGAEGLRDGWWEYERRACNVETDLEFVTTDGDGMGASSRADAEFIAHARTDVPALIAEVRRLRDELAQAEMRADAAEFDAIEADAR